MPGFGVNVPVEVVDSRGVIKDTNQLHSLVRHTANIGPRTRRRAVSSQGIPYSRVGSIAFQNASSISWSTDEVLHGLDLENTPWQDYDIPDELMRVLANTPMEILSIVRESIDNRRALKASMSAEASKLASSTTTPSVKPVSTGDKPATESSTSTRSQRAVSQVSAHTMDSTNPSRSSSPNQSIESTTTLGSSQDGDSKRIDQSNLPNVRPKAFRDHGLARLFRSLHTAKPELVPPEIADSESSNSSECASCFEDIPKSEAASLACQHKYCSTCFLQLVRTAMHNENFFPPKCCLQEIPRITIRTHLPTKDFAQFDEKAQEYAVPTGSRWYCSSPRCGKWIETEKRPTSAEIVCPHWPRLKRLKERVGGDAITVDPWSNLRLAAGILHANAELNSAIRVELGGELADAQKKIRQRDAMRYERHDRFRRPKHELKRLKLQARLAEMEAEQARLARLAEEIESKRRDGITTHYQNLRNALRELHNSHRKALAKRFESERVRLARAKEAWTQDQESQAAEIEWEKANVQKKTDIVMEELEQKQAQEISEIVARHQVDKDRFSARLTEELKDATPKLDSMEKLWEVQRNEREMLRMHQAQELQKWQDRLATEIIAVEERLRQQHEKSEKHYHAEVDEEELAKRVFADRKWYEVLTEEQRGMLDADERHNLESGADAPNRESHTEDIEASAGSSSGEAATETVDSAASATRAAEMPFYTFYLGQTSVMAREPSRPSESLALWRRQQPRSCVLDAPRPVRVNLRKVIEASNRR
ncbi:MAG: hypothetical protein FRX48_03497 [Lasallia pustulata]|uniref:RING-type domain-containing protein n=1 Tax=Lasallia pustulata TaxID=136370 RepID=A0A5M8PSG2_9LECA|nr:MAG: hypothetical protein FRX48_03497 [Lasallia pustulata]